MLKVYWKEKECDGSLSSVDFENIYTKSGKEVYIGKSSYDFGDNEYHLYSDYDEDFKIELTSETAKESLEIKLCGYETNAKYYSIQYDPDTLSYYFIIPSSDLSSSSSDDSNIYYSIAVSKVTYIKDGANLFQYTENKNKYNYVQSYGEEIIKEEEKKLGTSITQLTTPNTYLSYLKGYKIQNNYFKILTFEKDKTKNPDGYFRFKKNMQQISMEDAEKTNKWETNCQNDYILLDIISVDGEQDEYTFPNITWKEEEERVEIKGKCFSIPKNGSIYLLRRSCPLLENYVLKVDDEYLGKSYDLGSEEFNKLLIPLPMECQNEYMGDSISYAFRFASLTSLTWARATIDYNSATYPINFKTIEIFPQIYIDNEWKTIINENSLQNIIKRKEIISETKNWQIENSYKVESSLSEIKMNCSYQVRINAPFFAKESSFEKEEDTNPFFDKTRKIICSSYYKDGYCSIAAAYEEISFKEQLFSKKSIFLRAPNSNNFDTDRGWDFRGYLGGFVNENRLVVRKDVNDFEEIKLPKFEGLDTGKNSSTFHIEQNKISNIREQNGNRSATFFGWKPSKKAIENVKRTYALVWISNNYIGEIKTYDIPK